MTQYNKEGQREVQEAKKLVLKRLVASFNREDDMRNPGNLPFEIQFRTGCKWGRALSIANDIRTGKLTA